MTPWTQLVVLTVVPSVLNVGFSLGLYYWKKNKEKPHKEIAQLTRDVIALRVEVARIKGRMNFKGWLKGE